MSRIPDNAKPTDVVTLNFYPNAFHPWFNLPIKKKEATGIQDAIKKDTTLESYLARYGKVDPLISPREPKVESKERKQNHVEDPPNPLS